jgi:hypothetical protein
MERSQAVIICQTNCTWIALNKQRDHLKVQDFLTSKTQWSLSINISFFRQLWSFSKEVTNQRSLSDEVALLVTSTDSSVISFDVRKKLQGLA